MKSRSNCVATCALIIFLGSVSYAQSVQPIVGWKYIPQSEKFWTKSQEAIKDKNYSDSLALAERMSKSPKTTPLQKAEALLIEATTLKEANYSSLALEKFFNIIREFPGTQFSYSALVQVDSLLQQIAFSQDEFQSLFNRGAFKEVPESVVPMVAYFTALDNMAKDFPQWVTEPLKQLEGKSYWFFQMQYFAAISLVRDNKLLQAEKLFQDLESKEDVPESIRRKSALQRSRLLLTRFQYDEAEKIYNKYQFSGRSMGRIVYERAYAHYRNRDFSTALGMLKTLQAPFFETAANPEHYLSTMMIYRDLCYYDAVKKVNSDFEKAYGPLINFLKSGRKTKGNLQLTRMALQHGQLKEYADVINNVRVEKKRLQEDSEIPKSLASGYKLIYVSLQNRAEENLRIPLEKRLNEVSNEVIDISESIKLLSYISGLDEFRLKSNYEKRDYKTDVVDQFSFERLYWPVNNEYWWDEFPNYRVLLTDRCDGSAAKGVSR